MNERLRAWLPWILFGVVALAVGGWLGSIQARKVYRQWKVKRLVEEARSSFSEGEYREAALTAQRVLQLSATNVEASRIMAEVLESARIRESILWRRRLTELNPDDPRQRMAWASSALSFGEATMAVQALGSFTPTMQNTSAYHALAGSIAMAGGKIAEAEAHFAEAAKLEPDNPQRRLDLAGAQLQSTDTKVREKAESGLLEMAKDPGWQLEALRILANDATRLGRMQQATDLAEQLAALPTAKFSDQLIYLNQMRIIASPDFPKQLAKLQEQALAKPEELFLLISWMNANDSALLAMTWSKELAADTLLKPPVPLALGESHTILRDWAGLQAFTTGQDWGTLEFGRCALLSLALREQGDELNSKTQWINALRAVQKKPEAQIALARLTSAWNWESETEDLLWQIANGGFPPEWVLRALQKIYTKRHDTRGLYRLVKRELELSPHDWQAQTRVAFLALLLKDNIKNAAETSQQLYQQHPDDRAVAATYAFSLYRQKRNTEAIEVVRKMPERDRRDPDVAVYYALMLTEAGDVEQARNFFALGAASDLLPEEKEMVKQAKAMLEAP
jgi:Flp pilus assembly protein TadD